MAIPAVSLELVCWLAVVEASRDLAGFLEQCGEALHRREARPRGAPAGSRSSPGEQRLLRQPVGGDAAVVLVEFDADGVAAVVAGDLEGGAATGEHVQNCRWDWIARTKF